MASVAVSVLDSVKALVAGPLVHANLSVAELVETSLKRGEGHLAANGALVAVTGARTGRSPKDKFTVDDADSRSGRLGQGEQAYCAGQV